jgi:hypothetical protein
VKEPTGDVVVFDINDIPWRQDFDWDGKEYIWFPVYGLQVEYSWKKLSRKYGPLRVYEVRS